MLGVAILAAMGLPIFTLFAGLVDLAKPLSFVILVLGRGIGLKSMVGRCFFMGMAGLDPPELP